MINNYLAKYFKGVSPLPADSLNFNAENELCQLLIVNTLDQIRKIQEQRSNPVDFGFANDLLLKKFPDSSPVFPKQLDFGGEKELSELKLA